MEIDRVIADLTAARPLTPAATPPGEERAPSIVKMRAVADLLGNGRQVTVRLDTASRNPVTLIDAGRRVRVDIKRRWRPWSIATADLDGDGRREIIVALYKSTRYMHRPHNCLFVYRYDGREVYPLWLGSSLGRPFTQFCIEQEKQTRGQRLVTLDVWLDGRRGITVHRWTGFGFHKERAWGRWRRARLLAVRQGRIEVDADGSRLSRSLEASR